MAAAQAGPAPGIQRLPDSFYDAFISRLAKERQPSPIRSLFPLEKTPGIISLLAGKPNASTFPFTSFSFSALCPSPSGDPTQEEERQFTLTPAEVAAGLQYGDTQGYKPLLDWLVELQKVHHGRDMVTGGPEGGRLSIGSGSQDLIYKAADILLNDGDTVLVESPVYAGVIPIFKLHHCELIEVETDSNGIKSSSLRQILGSWPQNKPKPKVLYTVPYGCNPTGMTATVERRKEVLQLAREHNFIILEDDPYYYVYYGPQPRPASYFALEAQVREGDARIGRVLRFDSLSKVLSAGLRIGFASGPEVLLKAIEMNTATANLQTPGLTQVVAFRLLDSWGHGGFKVHSEKVSLFYKRKRDVFEGAMKKYLSGLAEWTAPEAGMFFWFKLLVKGEGSDDSETTIKTKAFEKGVLALPGTVFLPNGGNTPYVRAAFSVPSDEQIDEAMKRLREVVVS